MRKVVIVVHGGAGGDSDFIRQHKKEYEKGLLCAIEAGYRLLSSGASAVLAVEAAVRCLEDNPLFNAGRGSAINANCEVEMDACIMDGKTLNSGAVAIVKNIKNPVSLAKSIMVNTKFIYLGAEGALNYAKSIDIELEPDAYFITEHQYNAYEKQRKQSNNSNRGLAMEQINQRFHGTVGAVAVDSEGNVAAATSTGGTEYCKEGRIADSSMIGVGTYADNTTCALSCTGDGEYLMRGVIAHSIAARIKYLDSDLKEACKEVIHKENKDVKGDLGVIAVNSRGDICLEFNSERMHRAWKAGEQKAQVRTYKD